jgi:hypothetical protein
MGPPSLNNEELPLSDGAAWFRVMLEVALPRPLAQGLPFNLAVHHSQLGSVCTAALICAPAGTPGGPDGGAGAGAGAGAGVDGEPLPEELCEPEPDVEPLAG